MHLELAMDTSKLASTDIRKEGRKDLKLDSLEIEYFTEILRSVIAEIGGLGVKDPYRVWLKDLRHPSSK